MNDFLDRLKETLFQYYDSVISALPSVGLAIIVGFILWFFYSWLSRLIKNRLGRRAKDPLLAAFIANVINVVLVIFSIVIILSILGMGGFVTTIMAGAGISAFIIGFAFKDIGENFLAGILLAFKRPFRIGDRIDSVGISGKVIGLNLRETIVKTLDGKDVYIPNAMIAKNPLTNYTIDGYLRNEFTIGIDYEDDLQGAISIIMESIREIPDILHDEKHHTVVAIHELAASTINLVIYFWIETYNPDLSLIDVKNTAMKKVVANLVKAGYYLPADIVEIKNYNQSTLNTNLPG
jgi:small conductance mechanosensitive channel